MALNGVLLLVVVQIDGQLGGVRQLDGLHHVVPGHKAAPLQLQVAAHVQGGQLIVINVEKVQLGQMGHVNGGQLVCEGFNELQGGVVRQIQRLKEIVPAVEGAQAGAAGEVQLGQQVHLAVEGNQVPMARNIQTGQPIVGTVEGNQFGIFAHIQLGQQVVGAVQPGQVGVLGEIQLRQLVLRAIQRLQIGEGLQALQAGQPLAGQVQGGHRLALGQGKYAIRTRTVQVACVLQPGDQLGIGKDLSDFHITGKKPGIAAPQGGGGQGKLAGQNQRGHGGGHTPCM